MSSSSSTTPSSVLILGCGVFGLSTAYSLTEDPSYENTKITLIDRSTFPAPDGSSIDTSRIIRPDYADIAYARLGFEAQQRWRHEWWGEGVYHETGLALITNAEDHDGESKEGSEAGQTYMQKSMANVRKLGLKIGTNASDGDVQPLNDRRDIQSIFKQPDPNAEQGDAGDFGYVNWRSGWADAEGGMRNLHRKVVETGRVNFITAQVRHLLFSSSPNSSSVTGALLTTGEYITADLTILSTGAWTPSLLDLRGIASATGQILCYLTITDAEQEILGKNPTFLNESNGLFIIPPRNNILKVARHGYGYANQVSIPHPERPDADETITVSLPQTTYNDPHPPIPFEATQTCREFLAQAIPSLATRPFTHARLCWYTDTPKGDWLISYHPKYSNLFVATGGSGHGYKFLPVIGDKIVQCIKGNTPVDFREKWRWPSERAVENHVWTNDWRGGEKGMVLAEELTKGRPSRL